MLIFQDKSYEIYKRNCIYIFEQQLENLQTYWNCQLNQKYRQKQ